MVLPSSLLGPDEPFVVQVQNTRDEAGIMEFLEENTWLGGPDYLADEL